MARTTAKIIDMKAFDTRRIRRFDAPEAGAQILFFLGVRYERMAEVPETAAPVRAKPKKAARKRRA